VRIDPTDPASPKLALTHQIQSLFVGCGVCLRQILEIPQNIRAVFQVAASRAINAPRPACTSVIFSKYALNTK
jgi:hypothetical protein